jgi:hypothetical protein
VRPVVLVHVPKAAGSSLTLMLRRNQSADAVRLGNVFKGGGGVVDPPNYEANLPLIAAAGSVGLMHGHVPLGVADHLPKHFRPRFVTFLRDPVDRAISHYYHILEVMREQEGESAPLEPLRPDTPYEQALASLRYVPDNLHTRMLCGDPAPFGPATEAMLERAMLNLETRVVVFGLVERYDESMVLFKHRLGYRSLLTPQLRTNESRPRGSAIPTRLRDAARRANLLDIELYEFAKELFERAPERRTLDFRIDLAALGRAAARKSSPSEEPLPTPDGFPDRDGAWRLLLSARAEVLRLETELAMLRRKVSEESSNYVRRDAELAEVRAEAERLRARTVDFSRKLESVRSGGALEGFERRAATLAEEIAAQRARLERSRRRQRELDDPAVDAAARAEVRDKLVEQKRRYTELLHEQRVVRDRLRALGALAPVEPGDQERDHQRRALAKPRRNAKARP